MRLREYPTYLRIRRNEEEYGHKNYALEEDRRNGDVFFEFVDGEMDDTGR